MQNGIVTYIGNIRPGLEAAGVATRVLTGVVVAGEDEASVDLARAAPTRSAQALIRAAARVLPFHPTALMLGLSIGRALVDMKRAHGLDVFEMEESFGTPMYVQQLVDVPVVVRLHGPRFLQAPVQGLPLDREFRRINRAERACITRAVGITAPALDVLQRVRREYGLELPDAAVIPNPVPIIPPERQWSFDRCDKKTILFVGRFDRHKGGDLVIDAFQRLAPALPQAELLFVGPDHVLRADDGRTYTIGDYLNAHVAPEVRARIRVLGALPSEQIEPLRRQAFVTVVASRYEIFGLTLAESLAFGCPTIASNVGGMPEILLGDRTGLLCEGGSAVDLAAKIMALFENPTRAAELGRQAVADVAARLSAGVVGRTAGDYYQQLWTKYRRVRRRAAPLTRALYAFTRS
jgi:glycosyltransferase involved in cell wall biosynthesis